MDNLDNLDNKRKFICDKCSVGYVYKSGLCKHITKGCNGIPPRRGRRNNKEKKKEEKVNIYKKDLDSIYKALGGRIKPL